MSDDDFWGSDTEGDGHAVEMRREWETREANFWNSGYRDGHAVGKKETFQKGFNEGYAKSAAAGFSWGQMRGVVSTLQAFAGQLPGTNAKLEEIRTHGERLGRVTPSVAADSHHQFCIAEGQKPCEKHESSENKEASAECSHGDACCKGEKGADSEDTAIPWSAVREDMDRAKEFVGTMGIPLD
mmetsp:Transcript_9572/g.19829  ORF Transcript_9572/g.19829 Transcript_9572/m.19829 type:complete len:184 (-) Transcript_9572:106-657(-)|eukprot:CAMPEP_0118950728 /NCGR_PEP_ID=MMETSP1169-20130426/51902_1 /TAXON_ID=36882 /ORGANISM="Pyramimonas obovata, Strain CCMP722" /LENGTH=183 /DNA_ID=CAMNT_0006897633 /DNA_START=63 /DNA_END=614 /DNA_ORIENTATION=+